MKKQLFFFLLLAGGFLCVFAQEANQKSGTIREFTGEVELKRAGASAFVPAKPGDAIAADTIVSTGFKSAAIIEVGNSTIAIRPLTRLSLAEIHSTSDTETLNVNLQTGRVKVDVKPSAGARINCTVQSPSSTASVRGTSFEFDTCNLTVSEGSVAFRGNRGMEVLIPAGMTSSVDYDNKAVDPIGSSAAVSLKPLRSQVSPPSSEIPSLPAVSGDTGDIDFVFNW